MWSIRQQKQKPSERPSDSNAAFKDWSLFGAHEKHSQTPPGALIAHEFAVIQVLVSGEKLVHSDSNGGQDVLQLLQGLLRQGGGPAEDPDEVRVDQLQVGAAVDQRKVVVVCRQDPVGGRGAVCRNEKTVEICILSP